MQSDSNLRETLRSIDHKSYPAYKSLRGSYRFADYVLSIDHVQGDPFAAPSHVRVTVDAKAAAFPEYAMKNTRTRTALADELLRTFAAQINHFTFKAKGSSKVWLDSGANIIIESLETLTVIDVNSGKNRSRREEALFAINVEAAKEIARQLRLRNISGMILVDFINLKKKEQQQKLISVIREELQKRFGSRKFYRYYQTWPGGTDPEKSIQIFA